MLRKNLFIFAIGTIFTKILVYFLVPILTIYLSTAEYGQIDLITTGVELLVPITTLSIVEGVYRFAADKNKDKGHVLSIGLFMWLIGIILCLPIVLSINFNYKNLNILVYTYFALYSLFVILSYYVKGLGKTKLYTIITIVFGLFSFAFVLLFVAGIKLSIQGYYLGYIIALIIALIILFITVRPISIVLKSKFDKALFKEMIRYSAPLVFSNISWWILSASDKYITLWVYGEDLNGILAVVHKLPSVITVAFSIFSSAFQLSAFNEYDFTNKEIKDLNEKYSKIFNLLSVVLIGCVSAICIIIEPFSKYLLEKSYYSTFTYVPLYAFSILLYGINCFYGTFYSVSKKNLPNLISTIMAALINIGLCIWFMKSFNMGLYGAGLSTIIAYLFMLLYRIITTRKMIKVTPSIRVVISLFIVMGQVIFSTLCKKELLLVCVNSIATIVLVIILLNDIVDIFKFVLKRNQQ